jgi:hypothetical protein
MIMLSYFLAVILHASVVNGFTSPTIPVRTWDVIICNDKASTFNHHGMEQLTSCRRRCYRWSTVLHESVNNNNNEELTTSDDETDDEILMELELVADVRGRPAGVVMQDLNWRVEKLRLEEANTRRFLKAGPRFLPYEECRKWVQAWGNRWQSAAEW